MRIPFPERIPLDRVAIFAVLLFVVQTVQGTALYFSVGTLAFLIIATLAFNAGGGLTRVPGAYVFFYSVLVFVLGIIYKALRWEPAESNLRVPQTTIAVYVGGISAMFVAVLISRRLSRKVGLLQNLLHESKMYRASIGCLVFGFGGPFLISLLGGPGARINSAFSQLNQLLPLAIIIGTMYEIRRSGGKRSVNITVIVALVYVFVFFGLIGFSKQGMLISLYCWLVAAAAMRYSLSALQVVSLLAWTVIIFTVLVPYSQWGRRETTDTMSSSDRLTLSIKLLSHPIELRENYASIQTDDSNPFHYYNTPQGFWDRLQFIATDDSLNQITDRGSVFGYLPITLSFMNAVPHVFMPDKPVFNFGNMYAHEIGGLPDEDTTTGISFSPTAEAFHLGRWVGLMVVAPLIWLLLFFALDLLCGDLRASPWGLLVIALLSHVAPEQGIEGCIYMVTFGVEIVVFCAFFTSYVAPYFSIAVLGQAKPKLPPFRTALAIPRDESPLHHAE
ncbi:MAG: hypothetical protein M3O02_02445 [Acidobacteriota bacterium]|nr:hypothetical protein [Acidobacteriota bacterium]